jgi:sirohydrochlorin cobaltochelatase
MTINNDKIGILLVAFGTTIEKAQQSYQNIEKKVQALYPEIPVRWAYTSATVRRKLLLKGQKVLSPVSALANMVDEGFNRVAVQSLHIIPGTEYHDLLRLVHTFKSLPKGISRISVGAPLLSLHRDMETVCRCLAGWIKTFRNDGEMVMLMGHGTAHAANIYYPALQQYVSQQNSHIIISTVEGYPTFDDAMALVRKASPRKIWLVPFMTVAGDHAMKDMTGDVDTSWEKQLNAAGYATEAVFKGLGEIDAIVDVWINHLKEAMQEIAPQ